MDSESHCTVENGEIVAETDSCCGTGSGFVETERKGIVGKALAETVENAGIDAELENFILAKIEERAAAKKAKDFATADAIREELLAKGVAIKDTREGVKWELIS